MFFGPARQLRKRSAELTPRLYRLAWSWCHDEDLANDLVQETWARALERVSQLRDESKLLPWLSRLMLNLYRDGHRRSRDFLDIDHIHATDGGDPLDSLGRSDEVRRVRQAVGCLGEDQRIVLTLVDLMQFSYAEVADITGVPVGTVMSRLSRARRRLRELLDRAESNTPALRSVK